MPTTTEHSLTVGYQTLQQSHVLLQMDACTDHNKHLTVADWCLSRPLSIGLACSSWSSHQNVSPLTAVGGSGAKGGPCQYHSTKAGVLKVATINNCMRKIAQTKDLKHDRKQQRTLIHSWLPTIEQSYDSFLHPHPTTSYTKRVSVTSLNCYRLRNQNLITNNTLLLQTGACPDHCPLAWHVLVDPPTRMYPLWQL